MTILEKKPRRPIVLCVLDGWGHRETPTNNAIVPSNTPAFQELLRTSPHTLLEASGLDVGLPDGQMGNSEVGHLNLGAGRIVNQDIRRIDAAIQEGNLAKNPALTRFVARLRDAGGSCHLMGLVSPGGVHSHQDHVVALARIIDESGIPVVIHGFLDGRDTAPSSAKTYITDLLAQVANLHRTRIGTLCGRFYAMDRDQRWERVVRAYDLLMNGTGAVADTPLLAVRNSYETGTTDEFVEPVVISGYGGMRDGDGLLMANFRADRARQITAALAAPEFDGFATSQRARFSAVLGMSEYSASHNDFMETLFPPEPLHRILGERLSRAGKHQLRIAETEKYAHVTFFFNGGVETPYPGEDRILIPSPRVTTYDEQPEMSAVELTDRLVAEVQADRYDFILVNYANSDMVGHTGLLGAAERAVRTVDACINRLAQSVREAGGILLITADHGNAEIMRDEITGEPHTAHTGNPVPALLVNGPTEVKELSRGRLADIAPTILDLMDMPQPRDMTGSSLLIRASSTGTRSREHAAV